MSNSVSITVTKGSAAPTIVMTPPAVPDITLQRLQVFRTQEAAIEAFYQPPTSQGAAEQPLFYIASKKAQFVETQKLQTALYLNARDVSALDLIQPLFDNLHVVDDLVMAIVAKMPPQRPLGWQIVSQSLNLLNLPTVGQLRSPCEPRGNEASVAATVLQFFGVASYTLDRGYFIGHVVGYLFCCYYFAHLGISYAVTPLTEPVAPNYPTPFLSENALENSVENVTKTFTAPQWASVPELVRLLQELDESIKTQVYQLAVYAAQMSEYTLDKRIERMLIAEVNSFNKQAMRDELSQHILYGNLTQAALFQGLKPLK